MAADGGETFRGRVGHRGTEAIIVAIGVVLVGTMAVILWRSVGPGRDPTLPTYQPNGSQALAPLTGELRRDGACLLVGDYVAIWPAGYELRGDRLLDDHETTVGRLGREITVVGGETSSGPPSDEVLSSLDSTLLTPLPRECRARPIWTVGSVEQP